MASPPESSTQPPSSADGAEKTRFSEFELIPPQLLRAIDEAGFEYCTPIQAQSLVHTLHGLDVAGQAQTGTGKTAAFLITIFAGLLNHPLDGERYSGEPRALVLAPTRELALQIAKDAEQLGRYLGLRTAALVGGMDYQRQRAALQQGLIDLVVATPGRLIDFIENREIFLDQIEILVLDEADRMLDMGFLPQIRRVIRQTPRKEHRQTLLFSATLNADIMQLAEQWMVDARWIEAVRSPQNAGAVKQEIYLLADHQKSTVLINLLHRFAGQRVIVFANRRDRTRHLEEKLARHGLKVGMLSGDVPQVKRLKTLEAFRAGKLDVMVATDVAGRGIHIDDIALVINYDLPEEAEDYVHRVGRTGRAGATGHSISFASEHDAFELPKIEQLLGLKIDAHQPEEALLQPVRPQAQRNRTATD
ncbi:MAG TPA: DEAD/DEAH box helicase [Pseudomonadales bacterium]|jgi:ATP-dependent RNA helicase RhlB|nr:DEAD/DEAH box helicase [Pseudomonadales bacterium]HMZ71304.1 DEAD/DEAH box helicase [Pseudomonadales bacterium]HMZ92002.1 DEAD/DEAH box helicase [Pseudomonadales bacterium]HNB83885.1 DEAD/DEAH box helicase [Pseudomonadales bacterium]HNC76851.1 DEAD/DEAH box helicase [Pseudomonadales bacterium]